MRTLRATLLLAIALTAMAMAASTASAQTLEVTDEDTDTHCPSVTTSGTDVNGGCLLHISSEGVVIVRRHVFGIESVLYDDCSHEHWARIDEAGNGYYLEQNIMGGGGGGGCSHSPCFDESGEKKPWAMGSKEVAGQELLTLVPCFENPGGGAEENCEIEIPFNAVVSQHKLELGDGVELAPHGVSGFRCEIAGHWLTETGGSHDGASEQDVIVSHVV